MAHVLDTRLNDNHAPRCSSLRSMTTSHTTEIPVRLDFDGHAPSFSAAMSRLDGAATKELDRVGFDGRLRELVRLRASQLNGCAYCVNMHSADARAAGETDQRLALLAVWRETTLFDERERAAVWSGYRRASTHPDVDRLIERAAWWEPVLLFTSAMRTRPW